MQNPTSLLDVFVERVEIYLPAIDEGGHLQTISEITIARQTDMNCKFMSFQLGMPFQLGMQKVRRKAQVSEIQDLLGAF